MNRSQENNFCVICCLDFNSESEPVKYRYSQDEEWLVSRYCPDCVEMQKKLNWGLYLEKISKADCSAALKRLIKDGPPINLRDPIGYPIDGIFKDLNLKKSKNQEEKEEDKNIVPELESIFYQGKIHSAKLDGSLVGDKREKWWQEMKELHKVMEEKEKEDK